MGQEGRNLSPVPVQTGENFLNPGHAQPHSSVGGVADSRKAALLDFFRQQIHNLRNGVAGEQRESFP